jgi:hypothetical protein
MSAFGVCPLFRPFSVPPAFGVCPFSFPTSRFFPETLVAEQTASEYKPASDRAVFIVHQRPPRTSKSLVSQPNQEQVTHQHHLISLLSAIFTSEEFEYFLDKPRRTGGANALKQLLDDAEAIAPQIGREEQLEKFKSLIGIIPGTHHTKNSYPHIQSASKRPSCRPRLTFALSLHA